MRVKKTGTSMAAPHVAGAIALVLQRHPSLTAERIRAALIASAVREPGINDFTNDFGFGRVEIARCLELLGR
jgi:subtilisin family serine protease